MPTLTLTEVKITPLDAPLGAVVIGLDASQAIAPEIILQLKQALRDRHILIFKNQQLTDEQFLNFAFYFGSLFIPPQDIPVLASETGATPVIIPVSNVDGGYTGTGELAFHADHHWTPYPSSGSLLYALEVPSQGGETSWLNLNLAYETLDEFTKKRIADLQLITYNPFLRDRNAPRSNYRLDKSIPLISPVYPHPLVRTHPESGKKILYLDYATEVEVVGLEPQEGAELISQLRQHLNHPQFYYQHKWSVGDIVYWDNQATLHHRTPFDPSERRVLKRVSLAGSRPF
ncbi:taurine catabolism dioxygenase TauD/TfdA [Tolypothrix tenuis PCC 7101]|uniref:Taurine catabolism dioxygenase TauD/TfdA n=1 Tax=Tolypothrix tenuis PCC 7101 TaxID=231146 RepID=A0A1Z4MS04_9CYAN|nr:TauD/TfdA family dioxygenase [Aulosira sp. FACHB-113]BAY96250.1 taurine catabolism dioxygenase TauD/TfdA [Tolypothrix tenuis PCC 7101]BAZ73243.1 taurine catabolism dioxygenase TauD/TfdA [Aulosira laxa NIES-50]